MPESSTTSLTMLEALADANDQQAWERLDRRYRPLLIEFAMRIGLDREQAGEIAQRTAVAFCETYRQGTYDRAKGRFRNWLLGIARHEIHDYFQECRKHPRPVGGRAVLQERLRLIADPTRMSQVWDKEWENHVLRICIYHATQRFSERDMHVFTLLTSEGLSIKDAAARTALVPGNISTIKHRVLSYIRECRARIEEMG